MGHVAAAFRRWVPHLPQSRITGWAAVGPLMVCPGPPAWPCTVLTGAVLLELSLSSMVRLYRTALSIRRHQHL